MPGARGSHFFSAPSVHGRPPERTYTGAQRRFRISHRRVMRCDRRSSTLPRRHLEPDRVRPAACGESRDATAAPCRATAGGSPSNNPRITPDRCPIVPPRRHSNRDRYVLGGRRRIARARRRDVSLPRRVVECDCRFSTPPRRRPRRRRCSSHLSRRLSRPHRNLFRFTRDVAARARRRHWHARCFLRPCERHRPGACRRFTHLRITSAGGCPAQPPARAGGGRYECAIS